MVNLFCKLIINKRKTFDQVPDNLKAEVRERLLNLAMIPMVIQ